MWYRWKAEDLKIPTRGGSSPVPKIPCRADRSRRRQPSDLEDSTLRKSFAPIIWEI